MKHRWTLLLWGIACFFLSTSMKTPGYQLDSEYLKVNITSIDELRLQLTAQNETGKKLYLSVFQVEPNAFNRSTETEVFSEIISGEVAKVNRTLNLSKLESGTYRISVKAGKQRFEKRLDIRQKPVNVQADNRVIQLQ